MPHTATGPFDVKIKPLPAEEGADAAIGRMQVEKKFHGALDGTSKGTMMTGGSAAENSGVYVLIERVTGTLDGRKGSFLLHHKGVMTRGTPLLDIGIVPDSGTEELANIAGKLDIRIEKGGAHFYTLDYSFTDPLPAKP